jgi:lipoprotein-releasing system permease protein
MSAGPETTSQAPAGVVGKLVQLWFSLGPGQQIGAAAAAFVLLLVGVFLLVRRLRIAGLRGVLAGLAVFLGIGAVGFGAWTQFLPEPKGSYFVLWHQLVRVGAAVFTTVFVLVTVLLFIPWAFSRLERRGATLFVAVRHVRAKKSGFLTVISWLSILGVLLSSLALCVVISIMGGFGADLKRKILGNNAHVRIEATKPGGFEYWREAIDKVNKVPGVHAATPVVSGEVMASSASNTAGVIIKGIDKQSIGNVIDLLSNIEVGKFGYLDDTKRLAHLPPEEVIGIGPGGQKYLKGPEFKPFLSKDLEPEVEEALVPEDAYPGLIVGRELAKSLHVYVGDEVTLVSPLGDLGPMGVLPRSQKFRVAAVFYSGMYEYDSSHAYAKLEVVQDFLDVGHFITAVDVKVDQSEEVDDVRPLIEAALARKDLRVQDWKQLNRNLFNALQLEKIATFVILMLAIIVASFCIICTLLLMVTEKSKEIAILKAIGASDIMIRNVFMAEGVIIGGIGTVLGVTMGFVCMKGLQAFGFRLDPNVYYVDRLPIEVNPADYGLVALCALAITTLATFYPATAASRLRPVDGIRYE